MQSNKEIWIFLSHSSADFEKVRLIRNYLEEKSYRPLMFYLKCLNTEEETYNLITREIDVRTRFILCDSPNARASEWVKKEMNYITSGEHKRSYEVLDLSKPIEELQTELDSYTNKTKVYLSYGRTNRQLCDYVCNRLKKYDLNVFCDTLIVSESEFASEIKKNIQHAANNGYFIALCSNDYVDSVYCQQELQYAKEIGANIIPIALTEYAYDYLFYKQDIVNPNDVIKLTSPNASIDADRVTDTILGKVLTDGSLLTNAENMQSGRFAEKDLNESDKAYKLLLEQAEKSANPYALRFIGECYEYGHGVEIDLHEASNYYSLYIHDSDIGGKVDAAFLEHVRALNNKLYGHVNQSQPNGTKNNSSILRNILILVLLGLPNYIISVIVMTGLDTNSELLKWLLIILIYLVEFVGYLQIKLAIKKHKNREKNSNEK